MLKKVSIFLGFLLSVLTINSATAQQDGYWQQAQEQQKRQQEEQRISEERQQWEENNRSAASKAASHTTNTQGGLASAPRVTIVNKYGAVAFDDSRNSYGWSIKHDSLAEAEYAAIADCGGAFCKTVATFQNSCVAFAGGRNRVNGFAGFSEFHRNNPKIAEQRALNACSRKANNCHILVSDCSRYE
jgi:hypothetical protein